MKKLNMKYDNVQLNVKFTKSGTRSDLNVITDKNPTGVTNENISLTLGKISKWYEALVPTGGSSGKILAWNSEGTAKWSDPLHPTITKSADTTSTASPAHGGTFTTVDSVTRDGNGHVTKINTKTVTLPSQYTHPTYSRSDTSSTVSPAHGGTFTAIDSVTSSNGHVTSVNLKTITLPAQYTHPTYTSKSSGLYKITVDGTGHVSGTAAVTKSDIPALDYVPNTKSGVITAINLLDEATANITSDDAHFISQENDGSTTNYYRRKFSGLWGYINGKISAETTGSGNAVTSVSYSNGKITATKGSTFSLSDHTHNYAGSSSAGGAATSANILNKNNTAGATTAGVQYANGQLTVGTADGNAVEGSNASYKLWSYPAGGTAVGGGTANIQNLRLYWSSTYFRDIFISPNNYDIYHRSVAAGTAQPWRKVLDSGNYTSYALPRNIKHIHTASGTEGSVGWVKIARITVTNAYANHPMTFTIAQRGVMQYRIHLVLVNNRSVATAAISEFIIARDNSWTDTNNNPRAYIIKPSDGIFDLYIRKTEGYDHIFVVDFTKADGSEGDRYSVAWTNVHAADSEITGGTEAVKKLYLPTTTNYAGSSSAGGAATSANKLNTDAGSSTLPVYFTGGIPVAVNNVASGTYHTAVPFIASNGVMEVGKYIDFHEKTSTNDFDYRLTSTTTGLIAEAVGASNTLTIKSAGYAQIRLATSASDKAFTAIGIVGYPLTTFGLTTIFDFGGNTVVGGGESASTLYDNNYDTIKTSETETLYLSSDSSAIHLITNAQTYSNIKVVKIDSGNVVLDKTGAIIQTQDSTSNYTTAIRWWKGGTNPGDYPPSIGQHNTGGDSTNPGSICILPYQTTTSPWGGNVGLFIKKDHVYIDGTELSKVGHNHDYLPLSGGTMTGDITFTSISGDSYPIASKGIKWGGGTDAIDMYYNLRASDAGELIINMRDDSNVRTSFAYNGTVKSYIDTNGVYNGTATISTKLYVPRITEDSKAFAGYNTCIIKEYNPDSANIPSNAWYHIMSSQGDDPRYGTQLALGMTTNGVYYRRYNNATWGSWFPIGRFTATPTTGQVVITDGTTGGVKSSGYTIATSVPSNAVFTDTDTKVNVTLATTTKAYLLGTSTTPTSTAQAVTSVADTGVYLDTTAGTLCGTSLQASSTLCANTACNSTTGGLSLYSTNPDNYGVIFRGTSQKGKHGYVQDDWATYFTMTENTSSSTWRGWIFRDNTNGSIASIDGRGHAVFNGSVTVGGNTANTSGCRMEYNSSTQSLDFVFV